MVEFRVAFRNFLLNKRRTFLTLLSISAGSAGLLLALGFMQSSFKGLEANFISEEGHIQIFRSNYFQEKSLIEGGTARIYNYQAIMDSIMRWPEVEVVSARITFSGVVGNENTSQIMIGNAIIPENEVKIGLGGFFAPLVKGRYFDSGDQDGCYVGEGLAKKLGLEVGDYINLLTNTVDGSYNSASVKVVGIVKYGVQEYNDAMVAINLPLATLLLNSPSVDNLVILLNDEDSIPAIKARLARFFQKNQLDLIARDWRELSPYYQAVRNLYSRIFLFLLLLILLIKVLSIVNNVMMTVYERFREIGLIRAIGTSCLKVTTIFFYEAILLGVIGWGVGVFLTLIARLIIENMGFVMPPAPGRTYSYPVTFQITTAFYIYVFLICLFASVIGSIVPVIKAGKVKIIEALRYV